MHQPLNSKNNSLFRQLIRNHETKQYKKGLKIADQILRQNPNHGETQAMKALILSSQGQHDEAFALAKIALKNDMKSYVCWHVYGLLYRTAKNYEESIKAYKFALRLEPQSMQIQRDLALLQVQTRDYQGYIQSRMAILKTRPQLRQNWTALAVAHHLAGDLVAAENTLNTYESTLRSPPPKTDLEHSEAILYKNSIIAEMGDIERALEHLETIMKTNLDRTAVMEFRARYLRQLGRKEEAESAYRALLDRNNEYREYYIGLEESLNLDRSAEESIPKLVELYESYAAKSEKVDAPRRIPLDFLTGAQFNEAANSYLHGMLKRGVSSTFANVKSLYQDNAKLSAIENLVLGYLNKTSENISVDSAAEGSVGSMFEKSILHFLAQHFNYVLSRDLDKSMSYIDRAIQLDPECVEYHQTKARIWKHYGSLKIASQTMEYARQLDQNDRYISTKCAKYQLRNNENEKAIASMSKFTRNDSTSDPLCDLHDMQCMWYITEDGLAYQRQGNLGLALKRFNSVYNVFSIWEEDQFDFHTYSFRRGQIRAYIDMVRWQSHLRDHQFFVRAAIPAIQIYLHLYDCPHLAQFSNGTMDIQDMKATEKNKVNNRSKKDQANRSTSQAEKKNSQKPSNGGDSSSSRRDDPDPKGRKLIETKEPLQDAMKYLTPLLKYNSKNMEAQCIGFEVFLRRKKYILALKCLHSIFALCSLDGENPKLHELTVRYCRAMNLDAKDIPQQVSEVIGLSFTHISLTTDLVAHNNNFLHLHSQSIHHIHAGLRIRNLLEPNSQKQNEEELIASLDLPGVAWESAAEGLVLLNEWDSDESMTQKYAAAASKIWPKTSVFQDAGM